MGSDNLKYVMICLYATLEDHDKISASEQIPALSPSHGHFLTVYGAYSHCKASTLLSLALLTTRLALV